MTIEDRFKYISKIAYNFDIDDYLQNENKSLLILLIDSINNRFTLISGIDTENILELTNQQFALAKAGFRVNAHENFHTNTPVDILLISDIVLNSNPIQIDTIIIHELAHLLINSNNTPLAIELNINNMAANLYNATDIGNEHMTQHNIEFCRVLIHGCINYHSMTNNFGSLQHTVESTMRYDTFEDYTLI